MSEAFGVVHCKNCAFWSEYQSSMSTTGLHDCLKVKGLKSREDDFCSWGDMKSRVSVVYCKDCKNYEAARNEANGFCHELDVPMAPWEFCSRGERKDDE